MGESIMKYEFEVIGNITSIVKKKEVKKDVIFKKLFELDEVGVEEYTNEKGIVLNKECLIIDKQSVSYRVNYPYAKAKELLMPILVTGFMDKTKGYGKSNTKN